MSYIQLLNLKPVLESLSNYQKEIDGKVVIFSYKFTGATRMKIAKNIRILTELLENIEYNRKLIVNQYFPDGNIIKDSSLLHNIDTDFENLLNKESYAVIQRFNEQELFLDDNPIPTNLLAALLSIID